MADKKISELDAITGSNTAATDVFVVVDTSTGQTKKITREELNNAIEQDVLSSIDIDTINGDFTVNGNINLGDNNKAIFGAGSDLQIYHDGSNSRIVDSGTGNLNLQGTNLVLSSATGSPYLQGVSGGTTAIYFNGSSKLATTSTGVDVTGALTVSGDFTVNGTTTTINSTTLEVDDKNIVLASGAADAAAANGSGITIDGASATFTYVSSGDKWQLNKPLDVGGDVTFGDNEKAIFGAGSDLQIYHNGSHSYIEDAGSGDLLLRGDNLRLQSASGENYLYALSNGTTMLYNNNAQKLATTSTGIDVTGTVTADGLTVQGGGTNFPIIVNSTDQYAGVAFADNTTTSNAHVAVYADGNNLGFEAGNAERMRIDSSGNVGIGTSSPAYELDVAGDARANTFYFRTNTASIPASVGGFYRPSLGDVAYGFNTNELFRITSTGLVGIGTSSPDTNLEISDTSGGVLRLSGTTGGGAGITPYDIGSIEFKSDDDSVNGQQVVATVKTEAATSSTLPGGELVFETRPFGAGTTLTERMRIDSSGNVLIGSDSGDAFNSDSTLRLQKASGGSNYIQIKAATSGQGGILIGDTDDDFVGGMIYNNSSNYLRFDSNNAEKMRLESDGDLHVDGNVVAYSTTISDIRLKKDIAPIEDAVTKVQQLNGCTFTYLKDDRKSAGLIAQDVEKVLPSAVIEDEAVFHGEEGETYKTVQYDQVIGLLVEAVKELKAEIEELKDASNK